MTTPYRGSHKDDSMVHWLIDAVSGGAGRSSLSTKPSIGLFGSAHGATVESVEFARRAQPTAMYTQPREASSPALTTSGAFPRHGPRGTSSRAILCDSIGQTYREERTGDMLLPDGHIDYDLAMPQTVNVAGDPATESESGTRLPKALRQHSP